MENSFDLIVEVVSYFILMKSLHKIERGRTFVQLCTFIYTIRFSICYEASKDSLMVTLSCDFPSKPDQFNYDQYLVFNMTRDELKNTNIYLIKTSPRQMTYLVDKKRFRKKRKKKSINLFTVKSSFIFKPLDILLKRKIKLILNRNRNNLNYIYKTNHDRYYEDVRNLRDNEYLFTLDQSAREKREISSFSKDYNILSTESLKDLQKDQWFLNKGPSNDESSNLNDTLPEENKKKSVSKKKWNLTEMSLNEFNVENLLNLFKKNLNGDLIELEQSRNNHDEKKTTLSYYDKNIFPTSVSTEVYFTEHLLEKNYVENDKESWIMMIKPNNKRNMEDAYSTWMRNIESSTMKVIQSTTNNFESTKEYFLINEQDIMNTRRIHMKRLTRKNEITTDENSERMKTRRTKRRTKQVNINTDISLDTDETSVTFKSNVHDKLLKTVLYENTSDEVNQTDGFKTRKIEMSQSTMKLRVRKKNQTLNSISSTDGINHDKNKKKKKHFTMNLTVITTSSGINYATTNKLIPDYKSTLLMKNTGDDLREIFKRYTIYYEPSLGNHNNLFLGDKITMNLYLVPANAENRTDLFNAIPLQIELNSIHGRKFKNKGKLILRNDNAIDFDENSTTIMNFVIDDESSVMITLKYNETEDQNNRYSKIERDGHIVPRMYERLRNKNVSSKPGGTNFAGANKTKYILIYIAIGFGIAIVAVLILSVVLYSCWKCCCAPMLFTMHEMNTAIVPSCSCSTYYPCDYDYLY